MRHTTSTTIAFSVGAFGVALALTGALRPVTAQQRPPAQPQQPALPRNCNEGELLVSDGNGRFVCRAIADVLHLQSCQDGDFVVSGSGSLSCLRPGSSGFSFRALLPNCSSGNVLVSEGFGSWRCAERDNALPNCSSGQILVSEGSSGWRCADRDRR